MLVELGKGISWSMCPAGGHYWSNVRHLNYDFAWHLHRTTETLRHSERIAPRLSNSKKLLMTITTHWCSDDSWRRGCRTFSWWFLLKWTLLIAGTVIWPGLRKAFSTLNTSRQQAQNKKDRILENSLSNDTVVQPPLSNFLSREAQYQPWRHSRLDWKSRHCHRS